MPTRSKGCVTCRRRKVKCDEAKPTCNRCGNAYMVCGGYPQNPTHFVIVSEQPWLKPKNGRAPYALPRTPSPNTPSECVQLSPRLGVDLRAFQQNIWISYAATNLFPGNGYTSSDSDRSWLLDFIELDTTSLALPTACCVSALFFDSKHGTTSNSGKSAASYYCKALAELSFNLKNPEQMLAPANIAAVNLLGVYELATFHNERGWMAHAGGLSRLIETRGPTLHMQEPARVYYKICRLQILSQALITRKRTFLENPAWSSAIIWQDDPDISTLTQLVDILVKIPGLLESSDCILETLDQDMNQRISDLKEQLVAVLSALFEWRFNWSYIHPNVVYEVSIDSSHKLSRDAEGFSLFERLIFYRDFHHGRELILYNSGLLILLDLNRKWDFHDAVLKSLFLAPSYHLPSPPATSSISLPHPNLSTDIVALEICRSVEYNLQGPHQIQGAIHLMLPLRILSGFVTGRTKQWLLKVNTAISEIHGLKASSPSVR